MYCKKCGNDIDNDSEYCSYCGKKISKTDKNSIQTAKLSKNHDFLIIISIIFSAFIILIIALASAGVFSSNIKNKDILTRDAKADDIYISINYDFSLEISFNINPYSEIDELELEVIFADKNHKTITTKSRYIGHVNKNTNYKISFALTEFSFTEIIKIQYISVNVVSGKISVLS